MEIADGWRGVVAGATGVASFRLIAPVEQALVGGAPPFSPACIVASLDRVAQLGLDRRARASIAALLPWIYGAGMAVAYSSVRRRVHATRTVRVAALTAAIAVLELASLPWLLGRRMLRPRALAALAVHVGTFSAVVDSTLDALG